MSHTFIIMEAAACHDGDLDKAARLIRLAHLIGADACKFQWTSSPERLAERRNASEYLDAYRALAFPASWHSILRDQCALLGVEYMCTVYLPEDIPAIAPYVKRFKISSFEAEDTEFVRAHERYSKPVIISTGMDAGTEKGLTLIPGAVFLHCVSAYSAPEGQMNLAVLRDSFWSGLSDHSKHPWTGALAAATGAEIVEFHARLDDTLPDNADYAVARTPEEARKYVENIRTAEKMLGTGDREIQECEKPFLKYRVKA